MRDSDLTVFTVCNSLFVPRAAALAASLNREMPQVRLVVSLINVPSFQATLIQDHFPSVELRDEARAVPLHKERSIAANARVRLARELLAEGRPALLYLDSDSLVRRRLTEILSPDPSYDLAILRRPGAQDARAEYATGVIHFINTPLTRALVEQWEEIIRPLETSWFSDQVTFGQVVSRWKGEAPTIVNLPRDYIDWDFLPHSAIWVGKGPRKSLAAYREAERFVLANDGRLIA